MMNGIYHFPGNFESCLEVEAPDFTGKHCLLTTLDKNAFPEGMAPAIADDEFEKRKPISLGSKENVFFKPHTLARMGTTKDGTDNTTQTIIAGLLKYGLIRLGRCVPSVCTAEDVETGFLNFLMEYLNSEELELGDWFTPEVAEPVALNCHTKDEQIELD